MPVNLKTPRSRAQLYPDKNPYWETIDTGVQLGLYVGKRGLAWKGRCSNPGQGPRWLTTDLGKVEPDQDGLTYGAALSAVLVWAEAERERTQSEAAGRGETTVGLACDLWVRNKIRQEGKRAAQKTRDGWNGRAKALVDFFGAGAPLRSITAERATQFAERPKVRGDAERSAEGFNRDLAQLKAILTHGADADGYDGPRGWVAAKKLKAGEIAHRKADAGEDFEGVALSLSEVRALVEAADDVAFADFVCAMFLTLQRPQALRMADVRDFDAVAGTLKLRHGKNAAKKKTVLTIPLFADAVDLFQRLCAGRLPSAPLLAGSDGQRLPEDFQRYPFARAAKAAQLPPEASLYAVRRGAITHAATIAKVDVLTISQMADVDPKIILEHYFKRTEKLGDFADLTGAEITKLRAVK